MKYKFRQGKNNACPLLPILPHCGEELAYRIKLGQSWFINEPLTQPDPGWGAKLFSLGKFNYHRGGSGWGLIWRDGKIYIYPRYYENVTSGVNINHELEEFKIKLDQPDVWYDLILTVDKLRWFFNGNLVTQVEMSLPDSWLTAPFIGKGKDNNYNQPMSPAYASRDLPFEIQFL